MKRPQWTRALDPTTWVYLIIASVILIGGVLWVAWILGAPAREAAQRAQTTIAEGQAAAGRDAIGINEKARDAAEASKDLDRKNADEIRKAPGADQPLDPDLNRTGNLRVCHRAAYRCSSKCVQLLGRCDPKSQG